MSKPRKYTSKEAYERHLQQTVEYNRIHRQAAYRNQRKSTARRFIKKDARKEELLELQSLIQMRLDNNMEELD